MYFTVHLILPISENTPTRSTANSNKPENAWNSIGVPIRPEQTLKDLVNAAMQRAEQLYGHGTFAATYECGQLQDPLATEMVLSDRIGDMWEASAPQVERQLYMHMRRKTSQSSPAGPVSSSALPNAYAVEDIEDDLVRDGPARVDSQGFKVPPRPSRLFNKRKLPMDLVSSSPPEAAPALKCVRTDGQAPTPPSSDPRPSPRNYQFVLDGSRKPASKVNPDWSEEEDELLRQAIEKGLKSTRMRELLPNRTPSAIRTRKHALSIMKSSGHNQTSGSINAAFLRPQQQLSQQSSDQGSSERTSGPPTEEDEVAAAQRRADRQGSPVVLIKRLRRAKDGEIPANGPPAVTAEAVEQSTALRRAVDSEKPKRSPPKDSGHASLDGSVRRSSISFDSIIPSSVARPPSVTASTNLSSNGSARAHEDIAKGERINKPARSSKNELHKGPEQRLARPSNDSSAVAPTAMPAALPNEESGHASAEASGSRIHIQPPHRSPLGTTETPSRLKPRQQTGIFGQQTRPKEQRKGLFGHVTDQQRRAEAQENTGGDPIKMARYIEDTKADDDMVNAVMSGNQAEIGSINAMRRYRASQRAIEDGVAPPPIQNRLKGLTMVARSEQEEADEKFGPENDFGSPVQRRDESPMSPMRAAFMEMTDESDSMSSDSEAMVEDRDVVEVKDEPSEVVVTSTPPRFMPPPQIQKERGPIKTAKAQSPNTLAAIRQAARRKRRNLTKARKSSSVATTSHAGSSSVVGGPSAQKSIKRRETADSSSVAAGGSEQKTPIKRENASSPTAARGDPEQRTPSVGTGRNGPWSQLLTSATFPTPPEVVQQQKKEKFKQKLKPKEKPAPKKSQVIDLGSDEVVYSD